MTSVRRMALGSLLLLALAAVACSRQVALTDEMRKQERAMLNESSEWADQIAQWETESGEMRAWHARHPASSGRGDVDAADLRRHEERLAAHERRLEGFRKELEEHQTRLHGEYARPERERVGTHTELWAEHQRLGTDYEMVGQAHEELRNEHAEIMAQVEGTASQTGTQRR